MPWGNGRGLRSRIAHGDFGINLDGVWDTVQAALPEWLKQRPAVRKDADRNDEWDGTMMNDNKPPMFGPSFVFDAANHELRSGKSALMNQIMTELAGKANMAETIIGNCTASIFLKSKN